MNALLYRPPERTQDVFDTATPVGVLTQHDVFATAPMKAVIYHQENEEELHTSFEDAISDRVLAMNRQLQRLSGSLAEVRCIEPHTDVLVKQGGFTWRAALSLRAWRLAGLALMLVLIGFDLMGLLVLHMR